MELPTCVANLHHRIWGFAGFEASSHPEFRRRLVCAPPAMARVSAANRGDKSRLWAALLRRPSPPLFCHTNSNVVAASVKQICDFRGPRRGWWTRSADLTQYHGDRNLTGRRSSLFRRPTPLLWYGAPPSGPLLRALYDALLALLHPARNLVASGKRGSGREVQVTEAGKPIRPPSTGDESKQPSTPLCLSCFQFPATEERALPGIPGTRKRRSNRLFFLLLNLLFL